MCSLKVRNRNRSLCAGRIKNFGRKLIRAFVLLLGSATLGICIRCKSKTRRRKGAGDNTAQRSARPPSGDRSKVRDYCIKN